MYFDLDQKFDIVRISEILQHRIGNNLIRNGYEEVNLWVNDEMVKLVDVCLMYCRHQSSQDLNEKIALLVKSSLSRLHIFRCQNSFQFLATIKTLSIHEIPKIYSTGGAVGMICIDSITAFWDTAAAIRNQIVR